MGLKIASGHRITNDEEFHDFDTVRFVVDDGRTMFEVRAGKDGKSIEVRGVEVCFVDGTMYSEALVVYPNCSNSILVRVRRYDDA